MPEQETPSTDELSLRVQMLKLLDCLLRTPKANMVITGDTGNRHYRLVGIERWYMITEMAEGIKRQLE